MLAVLYDVHGNLPALEAVLDDAGAAGASRFVLGGDYALFGPWPAETVERLRSLDARWIRGNGERWTAHPKDAPWDDLVQGAIRASRAELGDGVVAELDALPESLTVGETCAASSLSRAPTKRSCSPARRWTGSCSATPTSSSSATARAVSS